MKHYKGNYRIERDGGWEPEQCPATKKWMNTKRVLLDTWTMYKRVKVKTEGPCENSYETPVGYYKNEAEAQEALNAISE